MGESDWVAVLTAVLHARRLLNSECMYKLGYAMMVYTYMQRTLWLCPTLWMCVLMRK